MQTHYYAWKIEENKNLRNPKLHHNKLIVCIINHSTFILQVCHRESLRIIGASVSPS